MDITLLRIVSLVLVMFIGLSESCSVISWRHMTMAEILNKAEIVVYGQEIKRFDSKNRPDFLDSTFEVYCVFKNPGKPLTSNITIKNVDPVTSCSGTEYTLRQDIILALKRTSDDEDMFEWDEVNVVPDGAAFPVNRNATLRFVMSVCGLSEPVLPEGRSVTAHPTCPERSSLVDRCIWTGEQTNGVNIVKLSPIMNITLLVLGFWLYFN